MIELKNISKTFRVAKRSAGFREAAKALLRKEYTLIPALQDVSFTIEGIEFMNIFTDGSREFGKYPLSIYGEGVLKFYTFVIPIALFQYYPLLYLIGRTENFGLSLLPLVGFVFIVPCYWFFCFGLRKYQSTGS